MAYIKGEPLKELREKIIKIAASYVGQASTGGQDSQKHDPKFNEKLKSLGWVQNGGALGAYCNYTVLLIYREAIIGGNDFIGGIGNTNKNWEGKKFFIAVPIDSSKSGKTRKVLYRTDYGMQTPHTTATRWNHQLFNRFISVSSNSSNLGRPGTPSKFKKYVEEGYILPGDSVLFDWKDGNSRTEDHIGIYIAPANSTYTHAICIEGNTRPEGAAYGNPNGVWMRVRNISNIMGFNQLVLRENM